MAHKSTVDWEAIEREYRAGQLSVAEIARQHGLTHPAILKKAKKLGWTRNLAERVREAVTASLVTDEVTEKQKAETESETIAAAAARGVQIVREHRAAIGRAQQVALKVLSQFEGDVLPPITTTATALNSLSSSLKTLVGLERQAFNLDAAPPDDPKASAPQRIVFEIVDPR